MSVKIDLPNLNVDVTNDLQTSRVIVRQQPHVINQSKIPIPDVAGSAQYAVSASFASASLFAATASFALNASAGPLETILYVTQEGSDVNNGSTLELAFRTIKAATQAAANYISASVASPKPKMSIQVKTGYYVEEAPIVVPAGTSILGDDLRTVIVRPTDLTKHENLFLMNNGTYVWGMRLEGCEIDDLNDPRNGFFFALAPGAYITTSPYIQNCTAAHTPADKFYAPIDSSSANPEIGNGPGGMIVDDSVLDGYSPLKSMIVDAYTQVAFNGIGICVRGRGYAQLVSFFTNFSRTGVYCIEGGHASLLNSNTTFGDYGLWAKGYRILVVPDTSQVSDHADPAGASIVQSYKTNILNYMIAELQSSGNYSSFYADTGSAIYQSTIKDAGLLIDAVTTDLVSKLPGRIVQFTQGLFKGQDTSVGNIYTLPPATGFTKGAITVFPVNDGGLLAQDFILSHQKMRDYIVNDPSNIFGSLSPTTKAKIAELFSVAINTLQSVVIDNAPTLLQVFGSLITSTSHDFSYAGSGVNFLALPANQGGIGKTNIALRVFQEDGGRVYHTSGDETGDFYTGQDFVIRQATGTIEGRTFNKAIAARFTPLNLALES